MIALMIGVSVFGLGLGEPLAIPQCKGGVDEPVLCWSQFSGSAQWSFNKAFITFPTAMVPKIMRSHTAGAIVENNRLLGVRFETNGVGDQDLVLSELTAKFGKPSRIEHPPLQTTGGAKMQGILAEWNDSDVYVRFNSGIERIDRGDVEIDTAATKRALDSQRNIEDAERVPL